MPLLCGINHKQQLSRGFSNGVFREFVFPALSAKNYDEFSHFQELVGDLYVDIFTQLVGMNVYKRICAYT